MGKSDGTEEREAIRIAKKGKHTGEIAPLSAGKQTTANKEEIYGQRTMRKVEQKKKKTIKDSFEMGR